MQLRVEESSYAVLHFRVGLEHEVLIGRGQLLEARVLPRMPLTNRP